MDKKHPLKQTLTVGVLLLLAGTCIVPAIAQDFKETLPVSKGSWLYVGGSGPGNYTKIQDAIDNTSTGDTVYVFSGFYFENITVHTSITLLGEHRKTTIIDGNEQGTVVTIEAENVTIANFTIQNAADPYRGWDHGIKVKSNHTTIQNNILGPKNSYGISLEQSYHTTLRRNRFLYNHDALMILAGGHSLIEENTFGYSTTSALFILDSANNTIQDNDFVRNPISVRCYGNTLESINNQWNGNYWNVPLHSPKPILVVTQLVKLSFQYDRTPALTPHGTVEVYTEVLENCLIWMRGRVDGLFNTSTWDGTGLKIGRVETLGIRVDNSLPGGRLRYTIKGGNGTSSFQINGITYGNTVFELEDAFGFFFSQQTSLQPARAPRFRAVCVAKKLTETYYHHNFI